MGARVVLVEPPGGLALRRQRVAGAAAADPERGPLHLWLNAGKESVVLDLETPDGRAALGRLIKNADIVVHGEPPVRARRLGLMPDQLAGHAALITVAVTPYGLTGPLADVPATDLTLMAESGLAGITGDPARAPLALYGHQPSYQGGLSAAVAAVAAVYERERSGRGDYVDISMLDAMAITLEEYVPFLAYSGKTKARTGNRTIYNGPLSDIYRTRDGFAGIMLNTVPQWEALTIALGHPEWQEDPRYATWESRVEHGDELGADIASWFAERTTADAVSELQDLRVPVAPSLDVPGLLADPQLAARDFFVTLGHPVAGPLQYPGDPALRTGPGLTFARAPLVGEHTDAVLAGSLSAPEGRTASSPPPAAPLDGVRVLDITQVWAGPYASELLCELGATVIHVEGPLRPDMVRYSAAPPGDWERPEETGGYFHQQNRGKLSLTLDLSRPEGQAVLVEVAATCDIVVNNFSPRVMRNWGADYEALRKLNPGIITVGMPGFGATGPYGNYVCYGEALEGAAGLVRLTGYSAAEPARAGIAYLDPTGGVNGALLMLSALRQRQITGEGQHIDLSQHAAGVRLVGEAILAYQLTGALPDTFGNHHADWSPHAIYPAAGDDRWVALAVRSDGEWQALCRVAGIEAPAALATAAARLAARDEVDALVAGWTRTLADAESARRLRAAGIAAAAVTFGAELLEHPQYVARGTFPEIEHPVTGKRRLTRTPLVFARARVGTLRRAPLFGEHNRQILREFAGKTDAEVDDLEARGVVGGRPEMGGVMVL